MLATKENLIAACQAYYTGLPIMTDEEFDALSDAYYAGHPDDVILGYTPSTRERALEIPMYSLNKEKTIDGVQKWLESKLGHEWGFHQLMITPKFDGISICVDETKKPERRMATTRGDGVTGQYLDSHYAFMNSGDEGDIQPFISFGEAIMSKKKFKKYDSLNGGMYKNARNLVGSQINADKPTVSILSDIDYIRYGCVWEKYGDCDEVTNRKTEIDWLNKYNVAKVNYLIIDAKDLTHDIMMSKYSEWSDEYEIDGLVVELVYVDGGKKNSREKNNNPAYARAYKGHFDESKNTVITGITWQVSKHGKLKPVGNIQSVRLSGVDVTNVTLYNARNVVDKKIGIGAVVEVVRSGAVIPKVVSVPVPLKGVTLPDRCPSCNGQTVMEEVELICINTACPERVVSSMTAFFAILKCKEVGRGTMESMYKFGCRGIEDVMKLDIQTMMEMDKYGEKKATKIYNEIHACVDGITDAELMHASGCFEGIGSSTIQTILDGTCKSVADLSAFEFGKMSFVSFHSRIKEYVKITGIETAKTNKLSDLNVVFTGFRDSYLEKMVIENGGKISSGVSAKTTHLVTYMIGSGSGKETKAEKLGTIIMTGAEFESIINNRVK